MLQAPRDTHDGTTENQTKGKMRERNLPPPQKNPKYIEYDLQAASAVCIKLLGYIVKLSNLNVTIGRSTVTAISRPDRRTITLPLKLLLEVKLCKMLQIIAAIVMLNRYSFKALMNTLPA